MRVLRRTLTGTDDKFFIPFFNLANIYVHRNSTTPRKVTYVSHIKGDDVNREEFERSQIHFIFALMFEERLRDVCL